MKWDFDRLELTMERRADARTVVAWVIGAQQQLASPVFRPIEDDDSELLADLLTILGQPRSFLAILAVVENYDVWFTGRNGTGDLGRRLFLGAMMAAGIAPDGKPIAARTMAELLARDRTLDAATAREMIRRRDGDSPTRERTQE
jgi:hypothetical protein